MDTISVRGGALHLGHGRRRRVARNILLCAVLAAALLPAAPARAQAPAQPLGSTSFTAAASCWEIKQEEPSAADGVYWLLTPTLVAPEQFYCDMTTDGGGWVLVGRGREGWRTNYEGRGSAAQLRSEVDGPAAFEVRQLPAATIDGLLDGGRVDQLPDGIRLRRAASADGSARQEVRFELANRDRWVWTFDAEHGVGAYSFAGATGAGGRTESFGTNNSFRRVDTRERADQGYLKGWAYGSGVAGTSAASSYLWSRTDGNGFARPFTQVYLRPRLRAGDLEFPAIADGGTPASQLRPLLGNGVLPGEWGVTGLANGQFTELAPEVSAFAQVGARMFVGGNFRYAQRGPDASGPDRVEQPYLAAFDVTTGAWIPEFRPQLNQQVKSLAALPDGSLMVGGEFTQVNGATSVGAVRLNTTDGTTASGWQLQIESRLSNSDVLVRAMDVEGGWLYLGGRFTHIGSGGTPVYARMAGRVSAMAGTPDPGWNPELGGSVIDLDASETGDRVYASGYFATAGGQAAQNVAALNTSNGALLLTAWTPSWSNAKSYQQTVIEVGDRVWVGGSEHSFFSFDTTTFARLSGNITKGGGDFQSSESTRGVVYASCHCGDFNYSNAFTWRDVGTSWTQADRIDHVGAWDAATGEYIAEFGPTMIGRAGYGPWAALADTAGNVWFGGDLERARRANGSMEWVGGFARYGHRDSTAPTVPSNLRQASSDPDSVTLQWDGSSDGSGSVAYEVLRDERAVATTSQTSLVVPAPTASSRYFVRAIDAVGNRSASTSALAVGPDTSEQLVATGSAWRWQFVDAPFPQGWTTVAFDDSGWSEDPAVLGFGSTGLQTDIDVAEPSQRPLSAQFRQRFEVTDPSRYSTAAVTTVADDGVVVYVNGTEVGRRRMPEGELTSSTWPTGSVRTAAATADPVTFPVPVSLLREADNVVAASTHLGWRRTPDISFDLTLSAE